MASPGALRRLRSLAGVIALLSIAVALAAACSDSSQTAPRSPLALRQAVAGAAAAQLDAADHFILTAPTPPIAGPPQITQDQAVRLAAAFLPQFGPMVKGGLEREHGGSIDLNTLTSCRRTLYARSPYVPLDANLVATNAELPIIQRNYGPFWVVPFCSASGGLTVLIAVSAYSTDLSINNGTIVMPRIGGAWFAWQGVPLRRISELAVGPEEAAVLAAALTGRHVNAVPELLLPARGEGFPFDARWQVRLDGATSVILASKAARETSELYIGYRPEKETSTIDVPAATQPDGDSFRYRTNMVLGQPRPATVEWASGSIKRDTTAPLTFEVVRRVGSNGGP
jgi:hypothetical protein